MTRWEIHDRAMRTAKIIAPSITVDPKDSLYHISDAEQQFEQMTGVVKRRAVITLNSPADGEYDLPADLKQMDQIFWAPDANTPAVWPVNVYTPDRFSEHIAAVLQNPPTAPIPLPNAQGQLYVMIGFGQTSGDPNLLSVFPKETPGLLVLRYKPFLSVYSPTNPLWAPYGANPETQMRAETPDESLRDAETGIVSYLVAQILLQQKDGAERFARDIQYHMGRFQRSMYPVAREAVEKGVHTTPQRFQPMGGMR